jgi:hypothetical protein
MVRKKHTVTILPDFTVFRSVDNKWFVTSSGKLLRMRVINLERYRLAAEPIADVISITIKKIYTHSLVKKILEILAEVREDEVSCVLELIVDIAVGGRVVQVDANCILYMGLVQVRCQVRRRRRVIARVADVVCATTGEA